LSTPENAPAAIGGQSVLTAALLIAFMQVTLAWSIENADWVPGLGILMPVVVAGVAVGALLSRLAWMPVLVAHGWSLVIGTGWTFLLASRILPLYDSIDHDWYAGASTYERMATVRDWYVAWLSAAATEQLDGSGLQFDMSRMFAAVSMALLLWLLAYICTWFALRYLSWAGAVLPPGFALMFNLQQSRREEDLAYMGFFVVCALLLASHTHLSLRLESWRRERLRHAPDLEFGFLRDSLVLALAVLALAIVLPRDVKAATLADLSARWSRAGRGADGLSQKLFPNLDYPGRGGGDSFGSSMPLTGAIELSSSPVFDARLEDAAGPVPGYWRMAVYDTYDGSGWRRTSEGTESGDAGELDLAPDWSLTVPVTQSIRTLRNDIRQLYAAPQPERVGLPVVVEIAGGAQDVLTISSRDPLPAGSTYEVVSRLSTPHESALRGADALPDPDWVTQRYLNVPDSVPDRVRALAAEITDDAPTRYDAGKRLESWLRRTMVYDESIDNPPASMDRVDWFLFEQRRGYCDYYSSSFVIMARSLGIPARVAAGYTRGDQVPETGAYRQADDDAHTWPEVFFPELGWVEFEPTASEAVIERPTEAEGAGEEELAEGRPQPDRDEMLPDDEMLPEDRASQLPADDVVHPERTVAPGKPPLIPIGLALGLIAVLGAAYQLAWRRPLRGLSVAEGAFERVVRVARMAGLGPRRSDTPNEFGRRLSEALPAARSELTAITSAFVAERFGGRAVDDPGYLQNAWAAVRGKFVASAGRLGLLRFGHGGGRGRGDVDHDRERERRSN